MICTVSTAISCASVVGLVYKCAESSASLLQIPLYFIWWKKALPDSNKVCMLTLYFDHPVQISARIQSYPHPVRYQYLQLLYDSTHFVHMYRCTLFIENSHYNPEIASSSIHCLHKCNCASAGTSTTCLQPLCCHVPLYLIRFEMPLWSSNSLRRYLRSFQQPVFFKHAQIFRQSSRSTIVLFQWEYHYNLPIPWLYRVSSQVHMWFIWYQHWSDLQPATYKLQNH